MFLVGSDDRIMRFKQLRYGLLLPLLLLTGLLSCKKETVPSPDALAGSAYYPLTEGHFIEYLVDSVKYNNFTQDTDFVHCEFRDEIISQFDDAEGRNSFIIQRSIRYDSTAAWEKQLTYFATLTDFRLEVVENNLRFIKLIFPVKLNATWNGNIYIPASNSGSDEIRWYNDWNYKYKTVNTAYNNGILNFPSTTSVAYSRLTNDSTVKTQYSDFTNYREVYARDAGLISRELTHWEYQPTEGFRNGFSMIMRARNHN